MKYLVYALVGLIICSCAPIRVNYDFDTQTNFSSYKTYNYFSDMETGMSELDTKRLLNSLDEALTIKGLSLSINPDFLIDIRSSEYDDINGNTVGVGLGGSGRNVGGGISIGIPLNSSKLNRQISIDFVEAGTQKLFWKAESLSSYTQNSSPEVREANLKAVVDKVLSGYPPKR